MKVLDLHCTHGHVFEGWFASEDDFQAQLARGLVACPNCGDQQVAKKLSMPRFNLGAAAPARAAAPAAGPVEQLPAGGKGDTVHQELQAAWLRVARRIVAETEDVGHRFADEARRIHHGDAPERAIRGQASPQETAALIEEGVPVMSLPLPDALKGPVH